MNKIITQKEIDIVLDVIFKANAPVQVYAGVKEMLEKLPNEKQEEVKSDTEVLDKTE